MPNINKCYVSVISLICAACLSLTVENSYAERIMLHGGLFKHVVIDKNKKRDISERLSILL